MQVLKETVPYIWWRLKKRPYLAIVVTATGFDALVWLDNPNIPLQLDGIIVGKSLLSPTNNSLLRVEMTDIDQIAINRNSVTIRYGWASVSCVELAS